MRCFIVEEEVHTLISLAVRTSLVLFQFQQVLDGLLVLSSARGVGTPRHERRVFSR